MATPKTAPNSVPSMQRILDTNEKVTGPAGVEMLRRSGLTSGSHTNIVALDNACGGGILTAELLQLAAKHPDQIHIDRIVAADIDDNMVSATSKRTATNNWPNVEISKQDQQNSSLPPNTFTHIFNNFGVFFSQDSARTVADTFRLLQPGGLAGFTSWRSIKWWPTVAVPALAQHMPDAPGLPDPLSLFPDREWSNPTATPAKLEKAGFTDVQVSEYHFTPEAEPEEFAEACAFLVKVVIQKAWPSEFREKYAGKIEGAMVDYLRNNYPGGKWDDQMVAIITLGKKPGA